MDKYILVCVCVNEQGWVTAGDKPMVRLLIWISQESVLGRVLPSRQTFISNKPITFQNGFDTEEGLHF